MLVPMALNPTSTPSRGRAQLRERTTVNTLTTASEDDEYAASYLPRVQIEGSVAVRASRYFVLRAQFGSFLDVDAQRVTANRNRAPQRAGYVIGATPTVTIPLDHARTLLTVGAHLSLAILPIAWAPYEECTDASGVVHDCGGPTEQEMRAGWVVGGGFGAFRWIDDRVRVGGTVGVRGQPVFTEAVSPRPPTSLGHVALVLSAEAQVQLTEALFLSFESQWLGVIGPYSVLPTVGLTLGGTIGDGPGEDPIDVSTWLE